MKERSGGAEREIREKRESDQKIGERKEEERKKERKEEKREKGKRISEEKEDRGIRANLHHPYLIVPLKCEFPLFSPFLLIL